jgi:hypothetical protein
MADDEFELHNGVEADEIGLRGYDYRKTYIKQPPELPSTECPGP